MLDQSFVGGQNHLLELFVSGCSSSWSKIVSKDLDVFAGLNQSAFLNGSRSRESGDLSICKSKLNYAFENVVLDLTYMQRKKPVVLTCVDSLLLVKK